VRESRPPGSVRGALSNERPHRDTMDLEDEIGRPSSGVTEGLPLSDEVAPRHGFPDFVELRTPKRYSKQGEVRNYSE
jgi:hypothetical protein